MIALPTFKDLCSMAEQNGIYIDYFQMNTCAIALNIEGEYFIALNQHLSPIKLKEALAHELGHCFTRGFYSISTPFRTISYIEASAYKWEFNVLLPVAWINERIEKGYEALWQFAEEAQVSIELVEKAMKYYSMTGQLI